MGKAVYSAALQLLLHAADDGHDNREKLGWVRRWNGRKRDWERKPERGNRILGQVLRMGAEIGVDLGLEVGTAS